MRRASITEMKNNLRALIDSLRDGSPVLMSIGDGPSRGWNP
jgi:hypothetical protein